MGTKQGGSVYPDTIQPIVAQKLHKRHRKSTGDHMKYGMSRSRSPMNGMKRGQSGSGLYRKNGYGNCKHIRQERWHQPHGHAYHLAAPAPSFIVNRDSEKRHERSRSHKSGKSKSRR